MVRELQITGQLVKSYQIKGTTVYINPDDDKLFRMRYGIQDKPISPNQILTKDGTLRDISESTQNKGQA